MQIEQNTNNIDHATRQGFVLTRRSKDTRKGLQLTYWLKTCTGPVQVIIDNEQAIFFVETSLAEQSLRLLADNHINVSQAKALPLSTFNHVPVTALYFRYLRDFYSAREVLKQHSIKCYEDDIRPEERYMMERFITDSMIFEPHQHPYNDRHKHYPVYYPSKCKSAKYDADLTVTSIDIECSPQGQLYSIGAYSDDCQRVFIIGSIDDVKQNADENTANNEDDKLNKQSYVEIPSYLIWVKDEIELLHVFIDWLNAYDPDIIIGWNVINFDFNLLQKRCELLKVPFTIGRDGSTPHWRQLKTTEQKFIEIAGRVILDGIDVLKTATYNFASFSLENVSNELLGKSKKVTDVDNRLAEIIHNFHHDKLSLAAYNLEDCVLVWQIFEQTDLIAFSKLRASLTGLALDRVGGSVAAFTNLYLPKLHRAGYIAPNLGDGHSGLVSPGGYVMDSIPGLYKNVLVLDFKSLYPSIIRTFKIDPMGLIEGLKHQNTAIPGYDGALFSRDKHFLPDIITALWAERDKAKAEKNAALSQAIKIIMNSFYGILGSTGCRFYDPRLSGSITKRSHSLLKTTKQWIEALGHEVIYGDTDSIFVYVGDEHNAKACQDLGKDLSIYINKQWQQVIAQEYQLESQLEIEFETHFSRFFMPTIRGLDVGTKKRYAGLVESKGEHTLLFKGLENVRTDWTTLAKDFQFQLYQKIFNDEPVADFVKQTVDDVLAGKKDDCLIYRKRIRRKLSEYVKNVPPHVKAARHADAINKKAGQALKHQRKGWIEYVMTLNGPQTLKHVDAPLDYDFYIERQLKSVADAILPMISLSFDQITDNQLNLF